jgi:secreted Zn-dependent insulinase-like peptidase
MLFMGSTKYPRENEFSEHIAQHGGFDNAFTEFEYTNY